MIDKYTALYVLYFHRTGVRSLGGIVSDVMLGDFINVSLANKITYLKAVNVSADVVNDV